MNKSYNKSYNKEISLPILPEEIYLRVIYQAILLELLDISKFRENKRNLLYSLLYNTHCAGCGTHNLVSLRGYVGRYCNKLCWRNFNDDDENSVHDENRTYNLDYIYEKYRYILNDIDEVSTYSNAISRRHRPYYNHLSPSGKVWPMMNKACYNEVICGISHPRDELF